MNAVKRLLLKVPGVEELQWRRAHKPESTWTAPRDDCPHPGWWTATDPQSTELEVTELIAALVRALQPELVIETGASFGQTARAVGIALRRNGHGRLISLEVDPALVVRARNRTRRLPVEILERSSLDFVPTQPIDFAWFDSLPRMRAREFRRFLPAMHAGTVVGFHDTGPHHAVRADVDGLIDEGVMVRLEFPTPRGVTFAMPVGRPLKADLIDTE